jgi:hypothetical protein
MATNRTEQAARLLGRLIALRVRLHPPADAHGS